MLGDSSLLVLVLLALAGSRGLTSTSTPRPAYSGQPTAPGREVARTRTGEEDPRQWAAARLVAAQAALERAGAPSDRIGPIALSLVAQWAHETARGKAEFNWNVGGWRARRGDTFHSARDVQTPGSPVVRWTAYPDLETGVEDQIARLADRFPSAWVMLLDDPTSSAWVEELGRRGYYGKGQPEERANYARAWAMHRTEIGGRL